MLSNSAVNAVPTMAELKDLIPNGTTDPECYLVLAYHQAGDGGGGVFYWDAASTDADDGGLILQPTSIPTAGRWKRAYDGPLHIAWWGAAGDGATDDTAALQAAFDGATDGVLVFDKSNCHVFTGQLTIMPNTRIVNNGATLEPHFDPGQQSAIVSQGGLTADLLKIRVPDIPDLNVHRAFECGTNSAVERIEISAVRQQNNIGLRRRQGALTIASGSQSIFGHISVSRFDKAVVVAESSRVLIRSLDIQYYSVGLRTFRCRDVQVLSGIISGSSEYATAEAGFNGALFEETDDVTVSNLIVKDAGEHGIRVGGLTAVRNYAFNYIRVHRTGESGLKILVGPRSRSAPEKAQFIHREVLIRPFLWPKLQISISDGSQAQVDQVHDVVLSQLPW